MLQRRREEEKERRVAHVADEIMGSILIRDMPCVCVDTVWRGVWRRGV